MVAASMNVKDYPVLFEPTQWGDFAQVQFVAGDIPDESLVSNVNVVPFVGQWVIVIKTAEDQYEIPGGTLEPDEPYQQTLRRELLEEAGARLKPGNDFVPIGYFHCQSLLDTPYRSHLPFPVSYRLIGYAEVEIISMPLNPPEGEQFSAVEIVPLEEAVKKFNNVKRPDIADLYRFASENYSFYK